MEVDGKQLLTVSEVARLLYVHPNTVRRWERMGVLPAYRLGPRGDRRFRREDVLRFLEQNFPNNKSNHLLGAEV